MPVTLIGTRFATGGTVRVSSEGRANQITVSNVRVVSATQITANFAIAADAAIGHHGVTVTQNGKLSNDVRFFVVETPNDLQPTLTSITPNSGARGSSVTVTLVGTNFITGVTRVNVGTNISVSNVRVVSPTRLTATLTIPTSLNLGPYNITVRNGASTSSALPFTVTPATSATAPALTSVSPNSAMQGSAVTVTLTGTRFAPGNVTVRVGEGFTVQTSNVTVLSATQIRATVTVPLTTTPGARNVIVTKDGEESNSVPFTVTEVNAPTLTSISPNSGTQGGAVPVTLTGTNFVQSATIQVSGSGVTASAPRVINARQIITTLTIAPNAAPGARNVTVTTPSTPARISNAVTFTVNPATGGGAPTLTRITPNSGVQDNLVSVTLTGTNFLPGTPTVQVSGTGVTVSTTRVDSATQITVGLFIAFDATVGARNVTVTKNGQTSNPLTFTVISSTAGNAPTLTSITPNELGPQTLVILTGTNFTPGATINTSPVGLDVTNVIVVSPTQIRATFTVHTNAFGTGPRNVSVTTPNGTSNTREVFLP